MALTVATNTGALMAQAAASSVNKEMEISMERLSTGKRINAAADDAAGIAIATRLTSEIKGTNQAIRNAMDGQALIDTAEGSHEEITSLLQRMREISVQAANDTNDANDRVSLLLEFEALTSEINRIADVTAWAGQNLLDGGVTTSTSHTDTNSFTLQIGSGTTAASDQITVSIGSVTASALGVGFGTTTLASQASVASVASLASVAATTSLASRSSVAAVSSTTASAAAVASRASRAAVTSIASVAAVTSQASVAATGTQASQASVASRSSVASRASVAATSSLAAVASVAATATRAAVTSVAAVTSAASRASLASLASQAAIVSKASGEIHSLSINSSANALTAINAIDAALVTINTQRAQLGSYSNRLDSTVSNLTNISNNLAAGKGRIEDADFAAETANLAKTQILQQASTAMLAQANASKQNVLSLLQG